mgnify:CR=1 FL=1
MSEAWHGKNPFEYGAVRDVAVVLTKDRRSQFFKALIRFQVDGLTRTIRGFKKW